jgi:hypothetical protein
MGVVTEDGQKHSVIVMHEDSLTMKIKGGAKLDGGKA